MKLLCIAALLLSGAAARPDSLRPWEGEKFPPAGGPEQDEDSKRGDGEPSMTQAPGDGDEGSGGDWLEWDSGDSVSTDEMPTHMADGRWHPIRPAGRQGNGNPHEPMKGTDGDDRLPGRPQVSPRGKRQVSRHFRRPKGPSRGRWPNRGNPSPLAFSMVFKVDNVTFQNNTDVTLKEGENTFLMPKYRGRGHHHHHEGGKHGPPNLGQYVKLIYNATEPDNVSIEYGVLKLKNLGEIVGEENNPEEDY